MKTLDFLFPLVAGATFLASGCEAPADEPSAPQAPGIEQAESGATAQLAGVLLDWRDQPVAGAEVVLAVGGEPVTARTTTDADGRYRLDGVPVAAVEEGLRQRKEVMLLFYSPREDLEPFGTAEGDRIHLLHVTLREFIDMDDLQADAEVWLRPAYVPLQQKGYKITDELMQNGGTLTWSVPNSPVGGAVEVSLVIEPGSIVPDGDDPQDEITLTLLDAERAPMQIPNDGVGMLWTIQPRDVRFDPPAKMNIKGERLNILGLSEADVGSQFEIFGATLDRGWKRYGDVQIQDLTDMTVTLGSQTGIIPRGAWGHVLSNPSSDAGALVTCRNEDGDPVRCAIWDAFSVAETQKDYRDQNRPFYYTDREQVCQNCTNIGAPWAQMATGLDIGGAAAAPVRIVVTQLCDSWLPLDNEGRDNALIDAFGVGDIGVAADVEDINEQVGLWATYCNDSEACPFYFTGEDEVQRARFSKRIEFVTRADHCAEDDRQ